MDGENAIRMTSPNETEDHNNREIGKIRNQAE
jgi:hypothetical protein